MKNPIEKNTKGQGNKESWETPQLKKISTKLTEGGTTKTDTEFTPMGDTSYKKS